MKLHEELDDLSRGRPIKNSMRFLSLSGQTSFFIRFVDPSDPSLQDKFFPAPLKYHGNFIKMTTRGGHQLKLPVMCNKRFSEGDECFACQMAEKQRESNPNVPYTESIKRAEKVSLVGFLLNQVNTDKFIYQSESPLRIELPYKNGYANLFSETQSIRSELQMKAELVAKARMELALMKEYKVKTRDELINITGNAVISDIQGRVKEALNDMSPHHPIHGGVFEMRREKERSSGGKGYESTNYVFSLVRDSAGLPTYLPLPRGWQAELMKYYGNHEYIKSYSNHDLECIWRGDFDSMEDKSLSKQSKSS
jgi:hypothetical protein